MGARQAGRQAGSGAVGSGPPHTAGAPVPVGLSPPTLTVTLTPHVPPCPALPRTALPCLQVATYVGFAAELYAWFCIGEIVGRGGSLTGYNV